MVHFGEFLKTWSLQSNSVTRQVSFIRTKIGGKCQNAKIQINILINFQSMYFCSKDKIVRNTGRKFTFTKGFWGWIYMDLPLLLYSPNFFCWKQKNAVSAASNQQERCYLLTKCDKKHIRSYVFLSPSKNRNPG